MFDRAHSEVELPAGIYEVKFGPGSWKGIEVRSGETTTITPGELKVEASVFVNASVVDSETGEKHGTFDNVSTKVTLMPGVYDLHFRKADVALRQGRRRQDHHAQAGRGHPRSRPEMEERRGSRRRMERKSSASMRSPRARRCRQATTSSRSTATSSLSRRPKAKCSR